MVYRDAESGNRETAEATKPVYIPAQIARMLPQPAICEANRPVTNEPSDAIDRTLVPELFDYAKAGRLTL